MEMGKAVDGAGFEGWMKSLALDILSLRCQLVIQMEVLKKRSIFKSLAFEREF